MVAVGFLWKCHGSFTVSNRLVYVLVAGQIQHIFMVRASIQHSPNRHIDDENPPVKGQLQKSYIRPTSALLALN